MIRVPPPAVQNGAGLPRGHAFAAGLVACVGTVVALVIVLRANADPGALAGVLGGTFSAIISLLAVGNTRAAVAQVPDKLNGRVEELVRNAVETARVELRGHVHPLDTQNVYKTTGPPRVPRRTAT